MLTLKQLKDMEPGIFAKGKILDGPEGINMTNSGNMLKWVAVRGGTHDWAIYAGEAERGYDWIKSQGNKVHNAKNIKNVVECDEDSFHMYRH